MNAKRRSAERTDFRLSSAFERTAATHRVWSVRRGMDGVGSIEPDGTTSGKRERKRDSLFLSARLRLGVDATVHEVRVRNLSAGGLMAELDRAAEPGTPVSLEMRGLGAMTGTVAWCTRGRLGIALSQPVDPARARKPVGAGAVKTGSKPLVVTARGR